MPKSQTFAAVYDFITRRGLATAKFDTVAENTSGAGILLSGLARLGNGGFRSATLSGADTLTTASQHVQILDPGGAGRNVTLPTGTTGMWFFIVNMADAAETLTVKDAGAATVIAVPQNKAALVVHNGTTWAYAGVITIAIS